MKKLCCVITVLIAMSLSCVSYTEGVDFSDYSFESLLAIRMQLERAIAERYVQLNSTLTPAKSYEGEILFRGIPWNTNANDVRTKLAQDGMIGSNHKVSNDDYMCAWKVDDDMYVAANAGASISVYSFSSAFNVAGYPLAAVRIYCPFSYDYQKIDRSVAGTRFMLAEIEFDVSDIELVFADLTNKLSSLYGVPEYVEDNNTYWILTGDGGEYTQYDAWNVWYGANDTGAYLHKTVNQYDDRESATAGTLTLVYGKTDGIRYLEGFNAAGTRESKAQDALIQQQNANNTDGL